MGAGQVMVGCSLSCTVTVKLQGADCGPAALFAKQVTTVCPTENSLPEAGEHTAETSGQKPSTFGVKVTTAPHLPGSLATVMGAGHSIVGRGSGKLGVKGSVICLLPYNQSL